MRRRKGRGSPPIPWPSPFTATGWRPDRISRSGRGRRPPRRRSRRSERVVLRPLRGRMGRLCVQANLSTWHGVSRGGTGAARPRSGGPGRPARGPRRTDRIQRGPRRSRALSGPPWSASGGWGSGRVVPPRGTGGAGGLAQPSSRMDRTACDPPSIRGHRGLGESFFGAGQEIARRLRVSAIRPSSCPTGGVGARLSQASAAPGVWPRSPRALRGRAAEAPGSEPRPAAAS